MSKSSINKQQIVLVTHPEVPRPAIDLLKETCKVIICKNVPPVRSDILENSKGVDAIFWADHTKLNAEALNIAGEQLKAISTMSAGIDFVDIAEVKSRGIPLGHTPGVLSQAVAELGMGLMIMAARRAHEGRLKIETSNWENWHLQWMLGHEIRGSTVGFIGFGGIGQKMAQFLTGFEVSQFLYHSRKENVNASQFNAEYVSLQQLLKQSDFIIVACPLTPETFNLINEDAFNQMKSNCVLVNIARGNIVDQKALYNALKNNKIFAAGIDVCNPEPLSANDPLLQLPNLVILPHLGSATERTRVDMSLVAAKNILEALAGKPMICPAY